MEKEIDRCNLFSVVLSLENSYESRMKGVFSSSKVTNIEQRQRWHSDQDADDDRIILAHARGERVER